MNSKLLIFCAGLALAATASVPYISSFGDLREAFETEDAFYLPISEEEATFLRLPRATTRPAPLSLRRGHGPTLAFIHNDESVLEPLNPSFVRYHNGRVRRSVEQIFETADAYYVPMTSEEAEELSLPQDIPELEDSADDNTHMEIITDEEVLRVNPAAMTSTLEDDSSRLKRQIFEQGGGSPRQVFDIYV